MCVGWMCAPESVVAHLVFASLLLSPGYVHDDDGARMPQGGLYVCLYIAGLSNVVSQRV